MMDPPFKANQDAEVFINVVKSDAVRIIKITEKLHETVLH
jgi:hypothetical protein